jgi:hypothetical protein
MKLGFIFMMLLAVFVISCSTPKSLDNQVDMTSPGMYRTIQNNGDELVVTLHVILPPQARFYFFEEKLPANAQLVRSDIAPSNTSIKEVFFSDVKNANFTYVLKANRGTYAFSGSYLIDGQSTDAKIKGLESVTI